MHPFGGCSIPGGDEEERAEAIERLFMKIDANSDGSITWDEFSTYMMLENQGSAKLRETEVRERGNADCAMPVVDTLFMKFRDSQVHTCLDAHACLLWRMSCNPSRSERPSTTEGRPCSMISLAKEPWALG